MLFRSEAVDEKYGGKGCAEIADFRQVLSRPDIDAVVISTPDHWHVTMALMALEAGKRVFCEKPTLTIAEGRELAQAVAQKRLLFATGLEDRSVIQYYKMAEVVRNGGIGRLRRIQVGLPVKPIFPKEEPVSVPAGLDWDMWVGPAPFRPYTASLTEPQVWRQIRDFSGGSLTDWGAHLVDTAQVANFAEDTSPVAVKGRGVIPPNSVNTVPQTYEITYTYANGVVLEVKSDQPSIRLEGDAGAVGHRAADGLLAAGLQPDRRDGRRAVGAHRERPLAGHVPVALGDDEIAAGRKGEAPRAVTLEEHVPRIAVLPVAEIGEDAQRDDVGIHRVPLRIGDRAADGEGGAQGQRGGRGLARPHRDHPGIREGGRRHRRVVGDPVRELAEAIVRAVVRTRQRGRSRRDVASICRTQVDPRQRARGSEIAQ